MRRHNKPRVLPLGTLAEATCRPQDWIDGLRWPLEHIRLSRADRASVRELLREYDDATDKAATSDDDADNHDPSDILQELTDIAEGYLPPYAYLGTLEGDGACFGVWACVDSLLEDVRAGEVWQPCARGDGYSKPGTIVLAVPRGELWVNVSDHGNVSLYRSTGAGKSIEVWGVV